VDGEENKNEDNHPTNYTEQNLLENLIIAKPAKKFPVLYGTRKFITV
jgi:hypothetical protein